MTLDPARRCQSSPMQLRLRDNGRREWPDGHQRSAAAAEGEEGRGIPLGLQSVDEVCKSKVLERS